MFVVQAKLAHGVQAQAEEHRVELLAQLAQAKVGAQALAVADLDTTDAEQNSTSRWA